MVLLSKTHTHTHIPHAERKIHKHTTRREKDNFIKGKLVVSQKLNPTPTLPQPPLIKEGSNSLIILIKRDMSFLKLRQ